MKSQKRNYDEELTELLKIVEENVAGKVLYSSKILPLISKRPPIPSIQWVSTHTRDAEINDANS